MATLRKTRRAWDEQRHAHFLTYSCYRRLPLLTRERSREWTLDALDGCRRSLGVALWAYMIMPEHVHALVFPRAADATMRRVLRAVKLPVSVAARRYLAATGATEWLDRLTVRYPRRPVFRFWQPGGGYDANIFYERSVREVMDYIMRIRSARIGCDAGGVGVVECAVLERRSGLSITDGSSI